MAKEFDIVLNPPKAKWLELLEKCYASNGWVTHLDNYELWKSVFEGYWLIIALDKEDESVIASITLAEVSTRSQEKLYLLGFYYCIPEARGHGIGSEVFKRAMEIVGQSNACIIGGVRPDSAKEKGRLCYLEDTILGIKLTQIYQTKCGFGKIYPYHNSFVSIKIEDLITKPLTVEMDSGEAFQKIIRRVNPSKYESIKSARVAVRCLNVEDVSDNQLEEFDEKICEVVRTKYLRAWLSAQGSHACIVVRNDDQKIVAISCLREWTRGKMVISPLYADREEYAIIALDETIKKAKERFWYFVSLNVVFPAPNENSLIRVLSCFSNAPIEVSPASQTQFTKKALFQNPYLIYAYPETGHAYS